MSRSDMERHDKLCLQLMEMIEPWGYSYSANGQERTHSAEKLHQMREAGAISEFARDAPDYRVWGGMARPFLMDVKHARAKHQCTVSIKEPALAAYVKWSQIEKLPMIIAGHTDELGFRFFTLHYAYKYRNNRRPDQNGGGHHFIFIPVRPAATFEQVFGSMDPLGVIP